MAPTINPQTLMLPDVIADDLQSALQRMADEDWVGRIWRGDAHLWRDEPEHVAEISNRLGWLHLPERAVPEVARLTDLGEQVRAQFDRIVLLGMGGSSLAPWCFGEVFGHAPGYPELSVLDSTVPADVLGATGDTPLERCAFIVSSKSGTTTETLAAFEYFWAEMSAAAHVEDPGAHFLVITDPDTPLAELGKERKVRAVLTNRPDIGGRYSALSLFGLAPAALLGLPIRPLLDMAAEMAAACGPEVAPADNPGAELGALLGVCHEQGRDKVTLLTGEGLGSFGDWAEQLLAESTGKEGKGLVPVAGEPLLEVDHYGADRVFVELHLAGDGSLAALTAALAAAGHPVMRIELPAPVALGAEMFRWEFATAVAGAMLGINPFDQPDVQEAKERTREMLAEFEARGKLPELRPDVVEDSVGLFGVAPSGDVRGAVAHFVGQLTVGDYFAIMAYLPRERAVDDAVTRMRAEIAEARGVATTFGYGPRFLHSTGQLHKGGPNTGVFLQLTGANEEDVPIPGRPYGFATLKDAQAAGDFAALQARGRRVLRVELGENWAENLGRLTEMVSDAAWD